MIWDSTPWKDELLRSAERLSRVERQRHLTQKALFLVEREIVMGCYLIRKLIEAFKVSDLTKKRTCKVKRFRNLELVNYSNWHRLDQLYDLEHGATGSIEVRTLCNQVVHSYVFLTGENGDAERGIYLASDRNRNREITFVPLKEIIQVFRTIGQDYPNEMHWTWDPKTGKEEITARNGLLEPTSI